jgi:hypothetical protein
VALRRLSNSSIQTNGKSSKLWDQTTFQSGMFALATVSLTSTASSVVFSDIPTNYTHLQIRALAPVGNFITGILRFNTDSGTNYMRHRLLSNGVNAPQSTASSTSATYIDIASDNGFGRSSYPYNMIIDILDYSNTSKNKTVRMLAGFETNATDGGEVCLQSGLWRSTSSISTVTFALTSGNYPAKTTFALYGIKAG